MRERKKSSAEAGTESPQGTFGNSPPFQRREKRRQTIKSPQGTVEYCVLQFKPCPTERKVSRCIVFSPRKNAGSHPFRPFSIRHDTRGCPILCCEARSFFFELHSKGWDYNHRPYPRDCAGFPELVMWRKDHRIPPFAKTKNAKDGAPSCVVAQAKVGHPP